MAKLDNLIILINNYLWGIPMLLLLLGLHIFLTFRLRFIQRYIWKAIKLSFSKSDDSLGDISHFGALSTALAATIGTGNIIGVATAVAHGGPGAIFWLWLTGVFGIATKYSEALLAIKYRQKTSDGTFLGGPMIVLEKGLRQKWLGVCFALFTCLAAFGIGNMVQANSISNMMKDTFNVSPFICGVILSLLTAMVILGGIKSIAKFCIAFVPFMSIFYIISCIVIISLNYEYIIPAIILIIKSAFTVKAASFGFVASTMISAARYGISRGLFSNEAGLGSAPIVAAAAKTKNPVSQALVSSTGTFWDTVIICALTGLTIVTSGIKEPNMIKGLSGPFISNAIFSQISFVGQFLLSISLFTFVFSTIIGWSYYGERALEYLVGKKAIMPYRVLWVFAILFGSIASLPFVWNFADAMNALMALPNIISLIMLNKIIVSETKKYLWEKRIDLTH
jgi:AGCS family alanine or glycine:cation symporter